MIKANITHPDLLCSLARCGHKTNILIADGNYSFATNSPKDASVIYLNLCPGMISSPVILEKILEYVNVEKVTYMQYPEDFDNTIEKEYKKLLPPSTEISYIDRQSFYALAKSSDTYLVIASGETRRFANILLTVGVVT